jgi:hypothetical protein
MAVREIEMAFIPFQPQTGETVLYHSHPRTKWYVIAGKILTGLVEIGFATIALEAILASPLKNLLTRIISAGAVGVLVNVVFWGLVPLLVTAFVVEEITGSFTREFILTDRRFWYKGAPFAWGQGEFPLEEVAAMTFRRDAVFVRRNSNRKIQVYVMPDGKLFVKAYEQFIGKK